VRRRTEVKVLRSSVEELAQEVARAGAEAEHADRVIDAVDAIVGDLTAALAADSGVLEPLVVGVVAQLG
jgi:hypothetical protein